MNFTELYQRIRSIDEGGVALPPEDDPDGSLPAGAFTAADQQRMNNNMSAGAAAATPDDTEPTTPVINLTDGNNGTMNLPDGSSVPVTLYPEGGMQPRMPPNSEKVMADLNGQQVTVWIYGGRGYVKNYVAKSTNENSNENFMSLYKRLRAIDEGTAPEPTAPGGVIKTKNADGTVSYKPKVPGERLSGTIPAQGAKVTDKTDNTKKEPTPANEALEECGDMMPMGMMGMSGPQGQQDNLDMNITLHGSGAGGVRDLMNILRNIESSDNKDVHSHDVTKIFGGEIPIGFDEEMSDGGFGAASTTPDPTVSGLDAVTDLGAPINAGDHRKRQAGLPQGAPMHETLVGRLSALYNEIKEAKEEEFDALKHVKNPTKGEKEAAKDVKRGSYADRAAMLKSAEADDRLKKESYNPNSVAANHARDLEKSRVDDLKKKAEAGDEKAKAALKRHEDKKAGMRADFDARMER